MQQFNNEILSLKNIVRVGIVSKVNSENKTARVQIPEQGIVTSELKIVQNMPKIEIIKEEITENDTPSDCKIEIEQWMPQVGQWVVCLFYSDGEGDGFILGGI